MKAFYRKISALIPLTIFILAVIGCNSSPNNSQNQSLPVGTNPPSCPSGATFSNYGACVGPNGYPQQIPGNLYPTSAGFFTENWNQKTLTITNQTVYQEFLQTAMGVCNRMENTGGLANCQAWVSGFLDVTIQTFNTQNTALRAIFRAWPQMYPGGWWTASAPNFGGFIAALFGLPYIPPAGAIRDPLVLDMSVSIVNADQGFEARSYGDFWTQANRTLIQIIVNNGKFENPNFNYQLAFGSQTYKKGMVFATGQFRHCSTPDCGAYQLWGY